MASELARLKVIIEAESSRLQSELDKTNKKLTKFGRDVNGISKRIKGSFSSAFTGIAAAIASVQFASFTKQSLDAADSVQKIGLRLGIATEAYSEYQHVVEKTGVSQKALETGFQRMTRRISEAAKGTGAAKGALEELGVDIAALNKLSPDKQFEALADAMAKVGDQGDKVRLGVKLFDTEGAALIQTMEGGSKAILELRKEARELGLTLSQSTADAAARANDALTNLNAIGRGLSITLLASLAPAIEDVANWLQRHLPGAIQVAADAMLELRALTLDTVSTISSGLASVSSLLSTPLPGTSFDEGNLDPVTAKLKEFSASMGKVSEIADKASVRIRSVGSSVSAQRAPLAAGVDITQAYSAAVSGAIDKDRASVEAKKKAAEAQRALNEQLSRVQSIIDENLTPIENYNRKIEELNQLRSSPAGAGITDDVYSRAVQKYIDTLDQATGKTEQFSRLRSVIDSVDPVAPLLRQLDVLRELEAEFPKYADIIGEAMLDVESKIDSVTGGVTEATKKVGEEWNTLGETFSSAFEDAIIEGKSLKDVLSGLEQDLLRIVTRNLVTKPLEQSINGIFQSLGTGGGSGGGGFNIASLFSGIFGASRGADFTVGSQTSAAIPGVDNRILTMKVRDGERVTVSKPGESSSSPTMVTNNFSFTIPSDSERHRWSGEQVARQAARAMQGGF